MRFLLSCSAVLCAAIVALPTYAQEQSPDRFVRARVAEILQERPSEFAGIDRTVQDVRLLLLDGPFAGTEITLENGIVGERRDMRLTEGEVLVLERLEKVSGEVQYIIREKYRLTSIIVLLAVFVLLGVLFGGRVGFTSLLGLGISIAILLLFVMPRIIAGSDPFFTCFIGALMIACTSLYLAHGFNRRTSIALLSTVLTLFVSAALAMIFVSAASLFGMGTEETVFLQVGPLQSINFRGLLLGGIIIGALGVLDDITTAQTAAIHEIAKANPHMSEAALYKAGFSVGKEHIASLINTLALAYVGASLPLLLLFSTGRDTPVWMILNSEFIAEEIVRTLVGSATLLFAVPISTWLAVRFFANGKARGDSGHHHHHAHVRS